VAESLPDTVRLWIQSPVSHAHTHAHTHSHRGACTHTLTGTQAHIETDTHTQYITTSNLKITKYRLWNWVMGRWGDLNVSDETIHVG
jgi:hypothetical protein